MVDPETPVMVTVAAPVVAEDEAVSVSVDEAVPLAGGVTGFVENAAVTRVLYPGLSSHPNHEVARRQMRGGFSGMLSIAVRGGEARAIATARRLRSAMLA